MVEREVIRRIIIEGQEFVNEISLTERPFFFEQKGNYVFVGIRQAGKSYLLYQRIQQLLREEHNINEIVYINFDDERLRQMTADDLDLILQAYHSTVHHCFNGGSIEYIGSYTTIGIGPHEHEGKPTEELDQTYCPESFRCFHQ